MDRTNPPCISPVPILDYTNGTIAHSDYLQQPGNTPDQETGSEPSRSYFDPDLTPNKFAKLFNELTKITTVTHEGGVAVDYIFTRPETSNDNKLKQKIDRPNAAEKERAQFHPLRHPQYEGYYNFEGRRHEHLTPLETRLLDIQVNYPDIPNAIMRGPFLYRAQNFAMPEAKQPDALTRVFDVAEIFDVIVENLLGRYEDLANFRRACQYNARKVQSNMMHLNTENDFLNWDKKRLRDVRRTERQVCEEIEAKSRRGEHVTTEERRRAVPRHFSQTVVISPVRPEQQGPSREPLYSKTGYPITSSVQPHEETSFVASLHTHYRIFRFMYLNGEHVKHLILHGLPWVDAESVTQFIRIMPKLEVLGVHQCFLLDFWTTVDLLSSVYHANRAREDAKLSHVKLDFTPFYYRGPAHQQDGSGHVGEFGIVPEDTDVDAEGLLGSALLGIARLCAVSHQDFFSPGTGFRSFMDRVPMPVHSIQTLLRCLIAIQEYDQAEVMKNLLKGKDWVDCDRSYSRARNAIEFSLYIDFITACHTRPYEPGRFQADYYEFSDLDKSDWGRCDSCLAECPIHWLDVENWCVCCSVTSSGLDFPTTWRMRDRRVEALRYVPGAWLMNFERQEYDAANAGGDDGADGKASSNESQNDSSQSEASTTPTVLLSTVDPLTLEWVQAIWDDYSIHLPEKIRGKKAELVAARRANAAKRDIRALRQDILDMEAQLGVSQRGKRFVAFYTWENMIQEYWTDLDLQNHNRKNCCPPNLGRKWHYWTGPFGSLPKYWTNKYKKRTAKAKARASTRRSKNPMRKHRKGKRVERGWIPGLAYPKRQQQEQGPVMEAKEKG